MEQPQLSEYLDFETPDSLFKLIQRDENDQFPLKVIEKNVINHDTYMFVLEFPNPEWISGLFPGGHYVFHAMVEGQMISRKYTPISPVNQKGRAEFPIKIYREHPDFPGQGLFTKHLENNVHVGESIMCEGPIGKCAYYGHGKFRNMKTILPHKNNLGLIAAGTGLTPLYSQALASSLAQDGLKIKFLFSNKTKDDILCMDELDALVKMNPDNLQLTHTLTRHNTETHGEWDGLQGRVNIEMIQKLGFPPPAEDTFIFICGSGQFNRDVVAFLKEAGYGPGMFNEKVKGKRDRGDRGAKDDKRDKKDKDTKQEESKKDLTQV